MSILQDKKSIINVLAGLMNNPNLLMRSNKYDLEEDDFPEMYHKIIFGAIYNLYDDGIEKITPMEIDGYLSNYPNQYRIYNDNKGSEILHALEEMGEPENFDYHFNKTKKYSLLRLSRSLGIDIAEIYDDRLIEPKEVEVMQRKFDALSVEDIVKHFERKVLEIKERYMTSNVSKGSRMGENARAILDRKLEAPSYGTSLSSLYLNYLLRGARRGAFYLNSGDTGSGKTRLGLAQLLGMCISRTWDLEKEEWVESGAKGKGLFMTTELIDEEIVPAALCWIAGVDEEKLNTHTHTEEEMKRLDKAVTILEKANVQFEELGDFDIADIMNVIERNIIKYGTEYVHHDYIHQSLKMLTSLSKAGVSNLREDQIILLMGIMLKDVAREYNIWMSSGTQLNKNYKEEGNLDESSIRGSRALADKVDAGMITLPIESKRDKAMLEAIIKGGYFGEIPTHTINLYKNRGNRWDNVRVWIKADLGTCRIKDLFCTDYDGNMLDIEKLIIEFMEEEEEVVEAPAFIEPLTPEKVAEKVKGAALEVESLSHNDSSILEQAIINDEYEEETKEEKPTFAETKPKERKENKEDKKAVSFEGYTF